MKIRWMYRAAAVAAGLAFAVPALPCQDSTMSTQEQPAVKKQAVASNAPAKTPAKAKAKSGT